MQYISQTINIDGFGNGNYTTPTLNGKLWGYQINRATNRVGNLLAVATKPAWIFLTKSTWPLDLSAAKPVKMPCVDDTGAVIAGEYSQCLLVDDTISVNITGATPSTYITLELWVE